MNKKKENENPESEREESETLKSSKKNKNDIQQLNFSSTQSYENKPGRKILYIVISLVAIVLVISYFIVYKIVWNKREKELKKYIEQKKKKFAEDMRKFNDEEQEFERKMKEFEGAKKKLEEKKLNYQTQEKEFEKSSQEFEREKNEFEKMYYKKKKKEIYFEQTPLLNISNYKQIHIAYAVDNNYTLPTLVSMTSACDNAKNDTFYFFDILISEKEFLSENIEQIKSIEKRYKRCKVELFDAEKKLSFFKPRLYAYYTKTTFYRLALLSLLPNVNRIIYLDADALILDDLQEMYNLPMEDILLMGHIDPYRFKNYFEKEYNVTSKYFVCAGVTLWNLELMRKNDIEVKLFKFLREHNDQFIIENDQGMLNYFCNGKIAPLPPKYGILAYTSYKNILETYFNEFPKGEIIYDITEYMKAFANPSIIHITFPKAWETGDLSPGGQTFYKYLYKTDYFDKHITNYIEKVKKEREQQNFKK